MVHGAHSTKHTSPTKLNLLSNVYVSYVEWLRRLWSSSFWAKIFGPLGPKKGQNSPFCVSNGKKLRLGRPGNNDCFTPWNFPDPFTQGNFHQGLEFHNELPPIGAVSKPENFSKMTTTKFCFFELIMRQFVTETWS